MGLLRTKTPIECAFYYWINNYPESFQPTDMDRFYQFVKTVIRYSRKGKGRDWLQRKIQESKKPLSAEDMDNYCNLFITFQDYDKAYPIRCLDLITDRKRVTRSIIKGKLVERDGI